jgi:DNA-binding NtrC family response regulator
MCMNGLELAVPDELELEVFERVAADVCILFTGTGSLQDLARRMHGLGSGPRGRFQAINCGLPEPLLDELLVHALRPGSSGTVFLENVERLSPGLQHRLVEILDGQGGPHQARARVMASTSEPLFQWAIEGTFNELLFYRLNAIHVIVPPDPWDPVDRSPEWSEGSPRRR